MGFVQGTTNTGSTIASPLSFTFGSGVATGNCIVGCLSLNSNAALTITATFGGVSCTILDQTVDTVNGSLVTTFILGNISGAPTVGSVSWSGGGSFDAAVIVLEESNCLAASNPTDVHAGQLQTSTTNPTSGNVTTTVANDNIVGFSQNDGGTTAFTAGSGFTLQNTTTLSGVLPLASEDSKVQVSPGAVAAIFTNSQLQAYQTFVVAIKPPAVASGAPLLARPISFKPYSLAPFLNRFPPGASNPPPQSPDTVSTLLNPPTRFKPFVKAPW